MDERNFDRCPRILASHRENPRMRALSGDVPRLAPGMPQLGSCTAQLPVGQLHTCHLSLTIGMRLPING
jgi:hypothetical protein